MKKVGITICIITHNRKNVLAETIRHIKKSTYKNFEIFIVDNDSTDDTELFLKKNFPEVTYTKNINEGISGKNRAFEKAKSDLILVLDDDSHPDPYALEQIVKEFSANPKLNVIACHVIVTNDELSKFAFVDKSKKIPQRSYNFDGCGVVMRKSVGKKLGGYATWIFIYAEETEFALRMLREGIQIWYYPNVIVYHRSVSKGRSNNRLVYFCTRNYLIIIWLYLPLLFAIGCTIAFLAESVISGIKRDAFGAFLKGTIASIGYIPLIITQRKPLSYKLLYPFAIVFLERLPKRLLFRFD